MSEESIIRTRGPPRLTVHNFVTFKYRVKKLPPDANVSAAINTKLYQFNERVCFTCAKCRRDNVQSDSVAMDIENRIILCTACFTRIIRPRTYRPSRVVPFPSLLSWLRYEPSKAMDDISENIIDRPAEAVAPSGERVALPQLVGGSQASSFKQLPAIAMNLVERKSDNAITHQLYSRSSTSNDITSHNFNQFNQLLDHRETARKEKLDQILWTEEEQLHHPCLRVWGACQHGSMCLFRNAPRDLCLAYLIGLCKGDGTCKANMSIDRSVDSKAEELVDNKEALPPRRSRIEICTEYVKCNLSHQNIYDLPQHIDEAPTKRYTNDLIDNNSPWMRWIQRRQKSPNSAEWQLMNNGPLDILISTYIPLEPEVGLQMKKNINENNLQNDSSISVHHICENNNRNPNDSNGNVNNNCDNTIEIENANNGTVKLKLNDIMAALHQVKETEENHRKTTTTTTTTTYNFTKRL